MATVRTLIGYIKGPKGDTGATGATGAQGPAGNDGVPGVTDYASTSAAGLVRVGDDFNINSSNGVLSVKNSFTQASSLANISSGESQATILGKISKFFATLMPSNFLVNTTNSTATDKALTANMGKTLAGDLATVQTSATASQAYAAGDYLVLNGKLYKVTTAIANGGTITIGTNVSAVTVADELHTANIQKSTLASGSLNACIVNGVYYLSTGSSYTNMPSGISYGLMTVWRSHPEHTVIEQTIYHRDGTYFRISTNSGGAWTDWNRYATMTHINSINSRLDGVFLKVLRQPTTSTTDTFTLNAASARHLLICIDSSDPRCGAWFVFSTAQNVVGYKEIVGGSNITVSTSDNKFIATHGSGTPYYLDICIDVGGTFLTLS